MNLKHLLITTARTAGFLLGIIVIGILAGLVEHYTGQNSLAIACAGFIAMLLIAVYQSFKP